MGRRVIITGAPGWVGRVAMDVARDAPGGNAAELILSARSDRLLLHGGTMVEVCRTSSLPGRVVGANPLVIHAGFPTQDQVEVMGGGAYVAAITELRATMLEVISRHGPLDLIYLSSGAATSVEHGVEVAERTQVYGQAKLDDEAAYAEAIARTGGRLCLVRAFALSGPYMTKPEAYALGSMIMQAEATGRIEVRATHPVRRSYMAIDDMLRIAMHAVGELESGDSVTFETAGEIVEMGELASRVLGVLGANASAVRRPEFKPDAPPNDYLGDTHEMERLANAAGVVLSDLDRQIAVTADWLCVEGIA